MQRIVRHAAAATLLALLGLAGCLGGGPAAVVKSACEAAKKSDMTAYWKHYSKGIQEVVARLEQLGKESGRSAVPAEGESCEPGKATIDGDQAVVEVQQKGAEALLLRKEEGGWVIWGIRQNGREIDMEKMLKMSLTMMEGLSRGMKDLGDAVGKAAEGLGEALDNAAKEAEAATGSNP